MKAQTSKQTNEPTIVYEFVGTGDVPTRVSPGNGETYLVDDRGCFEAPAKFAQGLHYLGFETRGESRVKPKANGQDRGKKGVSK
ncbi:MAG: hypothetical protein WB760_01350 [Xanthobacteraceae bacterium]